MIKLIEHIRYKKITENSEYSFFINSTFINEDVSFIQTNRIENLTLSQYEGYEFLHIIPIINIKCLKKIEIFVKKIDLQGLDKLSSLEELSIGEEYQNLELNNLSNLRVLYLVNGSFTGLQSLKKLKELTLVNSNGLALSKNNFIENSSIESLTIYNAKGQIDFTFLLKLKNLKKLDLYNVKSKIDLRLFNSFAESLEELKIEKCKEIEYLEYALVKFNTLKYLSLIDSVTIASAENISHLNSIEIIVVLGTSYFVNGEISRLRNLQHVSIDDKKHYSLKNYQLPKLPYD